jgi:rhamnogalacturonyl hydrolase YesR
MSPLLLSLALVIPLAGDDQSPPKSVEQALSCLRGAQRDDGHWPTKNAYYESAVTALAGLAFLSAGHVPGRGPEGAAITKAVRALLKNQRPDGIFAHRYATWVMYQQGLAVLFLSEALAGADEDLAREVRSALDKGVVAILKAQSKAGGWHYTVEPKIEDVSVTSETLLALKATDLAGIAVPREAVDKALAYVGNCRDKKSGGFAYRPGMSSPTWGNAAAAGMALALWVGPNDPALKPAMDFVLRNRRTGLMPYPSYTTRTVVQFTVQVGGEKADGLCTEMLAALAKKQREDGSWPVEGTDANYGQAYSTAEAVLALTAGQRRLRVFQAPKLKQESGQRESPRTRH